MHIWIVDVGVDGNAVELAGRVSATMSYSIAPLNPLTSCSSYNHGTEMAVIAARSISGVARKAFIHSARIDTKGNCSASTGAGTASIEFIADNSPRPAVINISNSQDCRGISGCGDTMDDATEYAHGRGVAVVVSAGNGNASHVAQQACGFSPARVERLITVGASDLSDARVDDSDYGSCVDLFAPVESGGGTSSATAATTGVAALFLQLYPDAPPNAVLNELVNKL